MISEWTGTQVGRMHLHRITRAMLAEKLQFTESYVSMVLNGKRNPAGAEKMFTEAIDELIAEQGNEAVE